MADDDKALVDRLRWVSEWYFVDPVDGAAYASDDPLDAADRIEALSKENDRLNANLAVEAKFVDKLSAENERLREALAIAAVWTAEPGTTIADIRAALGETK